MIIKWPLNEQYYERCDVIMTFRADVFEVDDDNDADKPMLGVQNNGIIPLFVFVMFDIINWSIPINNKSNKNT